MNIVRSIALGVGLVMAAVFFLNMRPSTTRPTAPQARPGPPSLPAGAGAASGVHALPKPQLDAIPPRLVVVLGQEDGVSFNARYAALKQLQPPLAGDEVQALYAQLYRHRGEDPLPEDDLHAFKNEVANALLRQQPLLEELPRHLLQQYADERQGEVWRDYCLQHLGALYQRADLTVRRAIANLLWKATGQKDGTHAGTALLALERNVRQAEIPRERLAARALSIAQDEAYAPEPRATALQVCVLLDERRALPPTRRLAQAETPTILRVSALGALGRLGDAADLALLAPLARDPDMRLRQAAEAACRRLSAPDGL